MALASIVVRDPRATLVELHRFTIHEVLKLADGLYSNIDDGLFEMADHDSRGAGREHCFNLMRDMRIQRETLIRNFTRAMEQLSQYWFVDDCWALVPFDSGSEESEQQAQLTGKSDAHFSGLLRLITERACHATGVDSNVLRALPIGPSAIAYAFVSSCRSLCMDEDSIALVMRLFSRFVLNRMGQVYAGVNVLMRDAGFLSLDELERAVETNSA